MGIIGHHRASSPGCVGGGQTALLSAAVRRCSATPRLSPWARLGPRPSPHHAPRNRPAHNHTVLADSDAHTKEKRREEKRREEMRERCTIATSPSTTTTTDRSIDRSIDRSTRLNSRDDGAQVRRERSFENEHRIFVALDESHVVARLMMVTMVTMARAAWNAMPQCANPSIRV